jgi:SEC-C motif-containing protein
MSCLCGNPGSTAECCGAIIAGERPARTAEQLMRSRYVAHVRCDIDYLAATQDPRTMKRFDREEARRWARSARWQRLRVVAVEGGGPDDDAGVVEFIASFSVDGELRTHHERSRFRRLDDGRWVYTDGHPPQARRAAQAQPRRVRRAEKEPRVGRNQPCPCGSGKKYKRCCGA